MKWGGIPPPNLTALVRSTVTKNGRTPPPFRYTPLRAGGATALCRATKAIDLSERFGRWGGAIYFRTHMEKSPNDGLAARPYGNWGGSTIHSATNFPAGTKKLHHVSQLPGRLKLGTMSPGVGSGDYYGYCSADSAASGAFPEVRAPTYHRRREINGFSTLVRKPGPPRPPHNVKEFP